MIELNPHLPSEKSKIKELIDYYQYRADSEDAMTSLNWRLKECDRLLSFPDSSEYDKNTCLELKERYALLKQTLENEVAALRQQLADVEENEKEAKSKSRRKKKVADD